jgi:hypothetical protein
VPPRDGDSNAAASARYYSGERLWITHHGDDVWVQRRLPAAVDLGRRQANDFAFHVLIDRVRRGAGPRWRPTELRLEGAAPGHAEELAVLAEGSTHVEAPAECLVFPRTLLALSLPAATGSRARAHGRVEAKAQSDSATAH